MYFGFTGPKFTWCNNRDSWHIIWKRLDKAMVTDKSLEIMPLSTITYLPFVGSNHCHLLMEMSTKVDHGVKYFRLLSY